MNNIARVFMDVHLGQGFQGLGEICKKARIDLRTMGDGDFVVFLNRKCTAFKTLNTSKVLTYYKHDEGRLPIEAIRHLTASFGGSKLEFDKAVEKTLRTKVNFGA